MSFLLAHLSDAHIGPLPAPMLRELMGKRLTGYVNWRRGRYRTHDMGVLARVVADMRAHAPDHVAMTGDILNIGLAAEFPPARAWLETLGAPRDVSFTPGNHDAYVRGSLAALADTFAPWTSGDGEARAGFPYLRARGDVALIGLTSGVPTAPLMASGRLGRAQREALPAMLDAAAARGLCRVVMIHHPPHRAGAGFGRGLDDAAALGAILRRHGAELVLHGHNHRCSLDHVEGPAGPIPVLGVASASAVPGTRGHRAAYHLVTIDGRPGAWRLAGRTRGLPSSGVDVGDLGAIAFKTAG